MARVELSNLPHDRSGDGLDSAWSESPGSDAGPDAGGQQASSLPPNTENSLGAADQQALALHRQFLQEVLSEVMPVFSAGNASDDRLISALQAYWEACFKRRATRRKVMELTTGTSIKAQVEPLGRPFFHMVVSELWSNHGSNSAAVAAEIYRLARTLAVDEALADHRLPERRQQVAASIRA